MTSTASSTLAIVKRTSPGARVSAPAVFQLPAPEKADIRDLAGRAILDRQIQRFAEEGAPELSLPADTAGRFMALHKSTLETLGNAADETARLARLCGQRADVCELYRQAVRAYWERPPTERGRPPAKPYAWVPK